MNIKWIVSIAVIATIVLSINSQNAFAHDYDETSIKTTADILDFCEFFYEEYLLLGENNLYLHHPYSPKLRFCSILYEHIIWPTEHPSRDIILIAEIEKLLGDSDFIKERHVNGFTSFPKWIRDDAKMWIGGKITDARFAYGIRALIDSKLINLPIIDTFTNRNCNNQICVKESDYVKYSITDSYGKDVITEKYTVEEVSNEKIKVSLVKTSKENRKTVYFDLGIGGTIYDDGNYEEGNVLHKFIYPIPLEIGSKISKPERDLTITHEISTTFNGLKRQAYVAHDSAGKYSEVIDKNSGLVFSSKFEDVVIVPIWKKMELLDTNIIEKKSGIQLTKLEIPPWWKRTTQWVLEGLISEEEYLESMEFLIGKEIIKV